MKETEARSSGNDELKCEKDRDRDKCPTTTHALNEALVNQRITRNDNHHGTTHPSSSKIRWREWWHNNWGQNDRGNKRGRRCTQYRNRATTTASGRAG